MIHLNIETTINGRLLKADSRLNQLITDFVMDNIGITPEPKAEPVKNKRGVSIKKWVDDETLKFVERVQQLKAGGMKDGQIGYALSDEFQHRSPGALYQKIVELKKKQLL